MVGRTISHYRIQAKLGEGGMGVVYKAEDIRLERTVALKFLAAHLVSDDAARKRFEREAKAVAALDHPNICTLFEIDEAEGTVFLAMAFVEGQTVKEKIAKRPLELEEALEIATQTAEGLRSAHAKGIVHRDIKPANVMVNPQRQVKVMDFGLARLHSAALTQTATAPTEVTLTQTATAVGTLAYMSPEQSQALPVDYRSDIWSLGVMLYEMITGRLPFPGQRAEVIFNAIRTLEPEPVTALRSGVPMQLELIVSKCLAKQPAERYQHLDDLIVDLSTVRRKLQSGATASAIGVSRSGSTAAAPAGSRPGFTPRKMGLFVALAAIAVVLAVLGIRAWRPAPPAVPLRTVKFTITPAQLVRGGSTEIDAEVSISGDGKHIAYVESQGGQLWVRDIDEEQARPVSGATGVYQVFWSPDNRFIGYSTGRGCAPHGSHDSCDLVTIPVEGGTPAVIVKLTGAFRRASWSADGKTIVYCEDPTGMFTVPATGGTPTRLVEHTHIEHPSFLDLPDGRRAFLYQAADRSHPGHGIYAQVMGEARRLVTYSSSSNPYPTYSPTGHIIYVDGMDDSVAIWALPFSLAKLQATGKAFPIARHGSSPQVSRTGTLVYSDAPSNRYQLIWCDRSGKLLSSIGEPQRQDSPSLSPDGRRLAVEGHDQDPDLWVYEVDRGIRSRFTFDPAPETLSTWTPSGNEITYSTALSTSRNFDIVSRPSSGNGEAKLLVGTALQETSPDWSPDQKYLIYAAGADMMKTQLLYRERRQDGSLGDAVPFRKNTFHEGSPRFSPDGHFIAYTSDESGRSEVYVSDFPQALKKWQISAKGGFAPRWRRDGREIFYLELGRLMAVTVALRPEFAPGVPVPLFQRPWLYTGYDVSADGKRFVVLEKPAGEPPLSIHVVHNWFEEFRGRQGEPPG